MQTLFGCTLEELATQLAEWQEPAYRAKQLASWMYQKGVTDVQSMSNLSKNLRTQLSHLGNLSPISLTHELCSNDRATQKFLFALRDKELVESVLMRTKYGVSVCVSSQVGCAMGCKFCASTLLGVKRNLTAGEMLAQVVYANTLVQPQAHVTHVVIMGSGEPLQNFTQVIKFLQLLHADYSLGLSYRNLTLSTCGIVPKIYALAEQHMPINLAISLHASNNELRSSLMPINTRYTMDEVIQAANYYAEVTKRQLTYEYIMLNQVNDTPAHAEELGKLLQGSLAMVNLIPFNAVKERTWQRSDPGRIKTFQRILQRYVPVTVRYERGTDIAGACGQLRNQYHSSNS